MYCGQFWVILGEDDKKYLNPTFENSFRRSSRGVFKTLNGEKTKWSYD